MVIGMTQVIITPQRIDALNQINRWRGWTVRPFSVLEHTMIGWHVIDWFKWSDQAKRHWLMHDMHETEIVGDVPTPDKAAYMNAAYFQAVTEFDVTLAREVGFHMEWFDALPIKVTDRRMFIAENHLIASRADPTAPPYDDRDPMVKMMADLIRSETYAGEAAVTAFWKAWGSE